MSMTEWAKNEVRIACARERKASDTPDGEWDYGCACYESALKAFKSLMEDGHSGMSFSLTRSVLERLMRNLPLTAIEDVPDVWRNVSYAEEEEYQCVRMCSLFKVKEADGSVSYSDVDRVVGVNERGYTYHSGLLDQIVNEKYPITMPYFPPDRKYEVYAEDFLSDKRNGDFDHVGVFYMVRPDGEREEINRFFDLTGKEEVEISKEEYMKRKSKEVSNAE